MITKAIKFRTSDGNEFNDKSEAKTHEAVLLARKMLEDAYGPVISTNRTESLLLAMVHDPLPALEALKGLARMAKKAA